jgi:hypothetical protein
MVVRPAEAVLVEPHDEWRVSDRRYLSEGSMGPPQGNQQGGGASPAHAGIDSRR